MANFYLRVPHYVASYFRNKDQQKPIPVGGVIRIDCTSYLFPCLSSMIFSNNNETIMPHGCFCERQWRRMLRGSLIYTPKPGATPPANVSAKVKGDYLTDAEVSALSNVSSRNDEGVSEYLCIRLPEEVYVNNRVGKTNGQWQLTNSGAKRMAALMTDEFWRIFFVYMDRDREWCLGHAVERSILDVIERFMAKYDIRNSLDNREKMTLKRNYYRKRKTSNFSEEDFVEHGEEGGSGRAFAR